MSSASLTLTLPLIYGSLSTPLPPSTSSDYSTHQWTLYIRSYTPLSPYIKSVTFHLHPSFDRSVRVVETCEKIGDQYVFSCTSNGWGEFESLLKITYTQPTVKPTILKHTIRLYPQATTGVVGGGKSTDQRVVNEFYDEICFEGVEKEWYEEGLRLDGLTPPSLPVAPVTDASLLMLQDFEEPNDREIVGRLVRAVKFVEGEIGMVKDRILRANSELEQARKIEGINNLGSGRKV
ncbi:hypothetical protein TrST_g12635 [Triparma strigata]|uniref:YEATS domain-containing protein n=1 Tax=Triparma strigata TaxID=1606541 RepID=A0A9W7BNM9_9STRA|nr:hypothetical protein TrST_g12635 [Triparma strigata]